MKRDPIVRLFNDELVVDLFAGGGGASVGIERALGRSPDIAINHDREAISMHRANHPGTQHYIENVWRVDPRKVCGQRRIALMWLSPDCKHFSKAKGGKPHRSKKVRSLANVAVYWAKAHGDAKGFVELHHYSRSYPAARLRVGLLRAGVGVAGVAVFSVPANDAAIAARCACDARAGVVLGRFVLLDSVEGNGETGAYELLRRAGAPERRLSEDGAAYVARALVQGPFRRVRHPGNHAYVWAVGRGRRQAMRRMPPALAYPKAGMVLHG